MFIPKHNAFFFHTPKAGGTSIEIFFLNDDGLNVDHHELSRHLTADQRQKYIISTRLRSFPYESQHATCEAIIQEKLWQQVNYSFTIVRNPYDRVISEWKWLHQRMKRNFTLDKVISMYENPNGAHFIPQWKYAYKNDVKIVDDVFKLENLIEAEEKLSDVFGIDVKFPVFNKTEREKDYKTYFNDDQLSRLKVVLQKDCELFGYEY